MSEAPGSQARLRRFLRHRRPNARPLPVHRQPRPAQLHRRGHGRAAVPRRRRQCWRAGLAGAVRRRGAAGAGRVNSRSAPSSTAAWISAQAEAVIDLIDAETSAGRAQRRRAARRRGAAAAPQTIYDCAAWTSPAHFHAVIDYPDEDIARLPARRTTQAYADRLHRPAAATAGHAFPGKACSHGGVASGDPGPAQRGQVLPAQRPARAMSAPS